MENKNGLSFYLLLALNHPYIPVCVQFYHLKSVFICLIKFTNDNSDDIQINVRKLTKMLRAKYQYILFLS